MGHKRHQKHLSNKHQHTKGPKAPDDERLWRRLTAYFEEHDYERSWTLSSILERLCLREPDLRASASQQKTTESAIAQALAHGKKTSEFFVEGDEKEVFIRQPSFINAILADVKSWQDRYAALTVIEGDALNSTLLEDEEFSQLCHAWETLLAGGVLPVNLDFAGSGLTKWQGFSLELCIKKSAQKISGLRFREFEPAMAYLLLKVGRWTIRNVLDMRLAHRSGEGQNPFPRTWGRLADVVAQWPEVDGDAMVNEGREDLRHLPFVTIDPYDARDFDDAVCLVRTEKCTTLWVAIADVAHYVTSGSSLDSEAQRRATSVYLPHTVLPMLPPKLADDLCSLKADVDRLAMVIGMDLDDDSTIIHTHAHEAVIRVAKNIAYEDALKSHEFNEMFALAAIWQSQEIRLGLEQPELRPRLSDDDTVGVDIKWPNQATKMIESFMVATNVAVGHLLGKAGAALPWRCHTPPDRHEVLELNAKLEALGVGIALPMPSLKRHGETERDELASILGNLSALTGGTFTDEGANKTSESDVPAYLRDVIDPEARQAILISLSEAQTMAMNLSQSKRQIVDQGLFQLMQRAMYSEENQGHFGLNADAYVHFTSPIRRYPDVMVHRQLKAFLHDRPWHYAEGEVHELALHCSQRGRAAKRIEWELVANAYHVWLMRDTVQDQGKTYDARIVNLSTPWIFLDLMGDGAVIGRMHVSQLNNKRRLTVDEFGLHVIDAEDETHSEPKPIVSLGQRFPCRIRGLDIWTGGLDLAPV